jgi:hypothetical protein
VNVWIGLPLALVSTVVVSQAYVREQSAVATMSTIAALRLAPLALVQSAAASGDAVLALLQAHGRPSRLAGSSSRLATWRPNCWRPAGSGSSRSCR